MPDSIQANSVDLSRLAEVELDPLSGIWINSLV
jgi:hypothetical protein